MVLLCRGSHFIFLCAAKLYRQINKKQESRGFNNVCKHPVAVKIGDLSAACL
jgi:hypothetical protein